MNNNYENFNDNISEKKSQNRSIMTTQTRTKKNNLIKPKFFKLLGQIMKDHMDPILNYLNLKDLAKLRSGNKLFLTLVHDYYPKRLRLEVETIKIYQEDNFNLFMEFMKLIDSQIPLSNKNWLEFDLNLVLGRLNILEKSIITSVKAIKNLGKLSDCVFAPFCIIFGKNKTNNYMIKNDSWHKIFNRIVNESDFIRKLNYLDYDNLNETDMLDAFVYLNMPELELATIRKYSADLEKLLKWCQAVISYHILIHPFTYRNDKSNLIPGSDMHTFITTMNFLLDRFYKFKRFLTNLKIMDIPQGEYVFNLQHSRHKPEEVKSSGSLLDENSLANIMSYIPLNVSYKLSNVNKSFKAGLIKSIDVVIVEAIREFFFLKIKAKEQIADKLPIMFENNLFSHYMLMLEDILYSDHIFLSKEQLNDIKNIKVETKTVISIAKILCLILNEKVEKKLTINGDFKYLYVEKLKNLVLSGNLLKFMKNNNKLDIPNNRLNQITEEINEFINPEKLEEVKKLNRGLYQLLIWEILVFEMLKSFNILDFLNPEYILNRFNTEDIELIKYYCEISNYLKYNLKARFFFKKSFNLNKFIEGTKIILLNQNFNGDLIYDDTEEFFKVSKIYFEAKEMIPYGAKPAFFEKIFGELIKLMHRTEDIESNINNRISSVKVGLGTIREENSILDKQGLNSNSIVFKELSKQQLLNNFVKIPKNKPITVNDVPQEVLIKQVLFYLDISSLPKFAAVNKKCNESVKTHMFIRLNFLNREKKLIEEENRELITSIENKRKIFYDEYEIDPPNKNHAIELMQKLSVDDVLEIKQYFKKFHNKKYEEIISPLVLLLGLQPAKTINPNGSKTFSFFIPAQKLLTKNDFFNKIMNFELETIPQSTFKKVEEIIKSPTFDFKRVKNLSGCFLNLIMWIMGVIEFHRVIRKYSLNSYDYDILDDDEIQFCSEMDNIIILYFKLLRYANTYCKTFEKQAHDYMNSMNINY